MPFLHKRDDPLTKCHRMWLTHLKPPYLPCRQGITNQASWESESESSQPALVPLGQRWQAHQHSIGVMPGGQPELGAAIIDEVVLGIEAAMHKLCVLVGLGEGLHPPPFGQWQERG